MRTWRTPRELGASVREVVGYEYAVIDDHALFPFKYADRPRPPDRVRLPSKTSPTRRRMLSDHGPESRDALFDLDDDLTTEDYLKLHEAFEELGPPRGSSVCSSLTMWRMVTVLIWGMPDRSASCGR